MLNKLDELKLTYRVVWDPGPGDEVRERVEAVKRWFVNDWQTLDNKVKSSIVEGVSVFLAMFDMPDVAKVFCPGPRRKSPTIHKPLQFRPGPRSGPGKKPGSRTRSRRPRPRRFLPSKRNESPGRDTFPPLYELIERGKVLALNMPAGSNPALARAVGVMLKNAWLQALLMRPTKMKESPGVYFRPAVFLCDEYQAFASVGEDDPSGDEKSFALTRQCRCIPIVATQSISSLRSVLGSSEAWRSLLQTLRTRIFLSLSDDAIRLDCKRNVRAGGEDQRFLHDQRDLQEGGSLPALRPRRGRRRQHRRYQVIPGAPGGRVSPARLHLAGKLSSDLSAL